MNYNTRGGNYAKKTLSSEKLGLGMQLESAELLVEKLWVIEYYRLESLELVGINSLAFQSPGNLLEL